MIKRYSRGKPAKDSPRKSDYEVGYGKPPLHSRFRPGQSGNPKGRPKALKNFKTDLQEALRVPVTVSMGGRTRKISTQTATMLKLVKRSLDGDVRALSLLLGLAQAYNGEDQAAAIVASEDDLEVLAVFEDRLRRKATGDFVADHTHDEVAGQSSATPSDASPLAPTKPSRITRVRSRRAKP